MLEFSTHKSSKEVLELANTNAFFWSKNIEAIKSHSFLITNWKPLLCIYPLKRIFFFFFFLNFYPQIFQFYLFNEIVISIYICMENMRIKIILTFLVIKSMIMCALDYQSNKGCYWSIFQTIIYKIETEMTETTFYTFSNLIIF